MTFHARRAHAGEPAGVPLVAEAVGKTTPRTSARQLVVGQQCPTPASGVFRWDEPVNRRRFRRLRPTVASATDSYLFSRQPPREAIARSAPAQGIARRPCGTGLRRT